VKLKKKMQWIFAKKFSKKTKPGLYQLSFYKKGVVFCEIKTGYATCTKQPQMPRLGGEEEFIYFG
jgi:hypothetical protein